MSSEKPLAWAETDEAYERKQDLHYDIYTI